jgi:hypothetical protein
MLDGITFTFTIDVGLKSDISGAKPFCSLKQLKAYLHLTICPHSRCLQLCITLVTFSYTKKHKIILICFYCCSSLEIRFVCYNRDIVDGL